MIYRLPVIILPFEESGYVARCEEIRATAMGDTVEEAIQNLREAIQEMVEEYGETVVFQDVSPESQVEVIEVAI